MPQAINIILQKKNSKGHWESFSINSKGIVKMTFDRYLGTPENKDSNILSVMDLTIFDQSGYELLGTLQSASGDLRVKYGFDNDMSNLFVLTSTKLNATYNELGCMVSIGAYGFNVTKKFGAAFYPKGKDIKQLLVALAQRNGWYIGEEPYTIDNSSVAYGNIDTRGLKLPTEVYQEADEDDITFIKNKIMPYCYMATQDASGNIASKYWDMRLYYDGYKSVFYCLPYGRRNKEKRVWKYDYGSTLTSNVLSVTNTIDYSYLIKGLSIQVNADPATFAITNQQGLNEYASSLIFDKWGEIEKILNTYGLPVPPKKTFAFNIEFIPAEEASNSILIEKIFTSIKNAIMAINTAELTVIGNPRIMPLDLVDLTIKNKDGAPQILSGVWKIVKIKETIGTDGYKTTLSLVREDISLDYS